MSGISRFSVPLSSPLEAAGGTIDRRDGYLVRLGEGPVGIGEATPLAGWTEPAAACRETVLETLAAEPRSLEDLPPLDGTPAARHGLELALLDRTARETGVPLYRLLGGDRRVSAVPVNATVGDGGVESTVDAASWAVERGFRAVKVKVGGRPVAADVERLTAVRESVGDGVELRVDANGAWTPDQAASAIDSLAAVDVAVVEQPLDPDAVSAHAELRGRGPEIVLDESIGAAGIEAVLAAEAADAVVLKPMALGGVGRCVELAAAASDRGFAVLVSTTVDAAVARTAAVHLAAALDLRRACGLATATRLARDVAADPAPVVDGAASVPQSAGHGVELEDAD